MGKDRNLSRVCISLSGRGRSGGEERGCKDWTLGLGRLSIMWNPARDRSSQDDHWSLHFGALCYVWLRYESQAPRGEDNFRRNSLGG